jgi:hypothetical protein
MHLQWGGIKCFFNKQIRSLFGKPHWIWQVDANVGALLVAFLIKTRPSLPRLWQLSALHTKSKFKHILQGDTLVPSSCLTIACKALPLRTMYTCVDMEVIVEVLWYVWV